MKTKKYSIERGWIRDLKNMEGFTSYESDEEYDTLEEAQKAFEDTKLYLEENEYVFLNVVEYEDGEFYDSTILNEATYADVVKEQYHNRYIEVSREEEGVRVKVDIDVFTANVVELLELDNEWELIEEVDRFLSDTYSDKYRLDDDERHQLYDKLSKLNLNAFNLDWVKNMIIEKSQYFSMKKVCENTSITYDRFKNWKNKGYGLSANELNTILWEMYNVMKK